ncbi:LysR family transcriptional regulator [Sneathiella aquimaris]|uniref:LysR family transcriptional regulator n=1 Tax=Sneathiella aquimaris TaxID=2599305 RepID=UPI001469A696|nr:LysR family transcriptional regulator [Sneathiella aquimaris]
MLNSRWLETFVTLADEGSFTRAAIRLNMTQPGVSQHLKKLEHSVGVPLIQRIGKTIIVTDAGDAIYDPGRQRLADEEKLLEIIGEDFPDVGPVGIGCSGSFATLLYAQLIPRILAAAELQIELRSAPHSDIVESVTNGHLDIGVISHNPGSETLVGHTIGYEDLCLITAKSVASDEPDFTMLEALGFIGHPDGQRYAEMLMPKNFRAYKGFSKMRLRGFVNQMTQIPVPVAAGAGYTILPRSGIDSFPDFNALSIARLKHPIRQELWVFQRAGRRMPDRCRWAITEIKRLADSLTTST